MAGPVIQDLAPEAHCAVYSEVRAGAGDVPAYVAACTPVPAGLGVSAY